MWFLTIIGYFIITIISNKFFIHLGENTFNREDFFTIFSIILFIVVILFARVEAAGKRVTFYHVFVLVAILFFGINFRNLGFYDFFSRIILIIIGFLLFLIYFTEVYIYRKEITWKVFLFQLLYLGSLIGLPILFVRFLI